MSQNTAIDSGNVIGEKINLKALAVNNGWFDPAMQQKAFIDYSHNNTYRTLIDDNQYNALLSSYNARCLPNIKQCTELTGQVDSCTNARTVCQNTIEGPLISSGDFDVYDIRAQRDDPNPPQTYTGYLNSSTVVRAIGAKSTYTDCAIGPYRRFEETGDGKLSYSPTLIHR